MISNQELTFSGSSWGSSGYLLEFSIKFLLWLRFSWQNLWFCFPSVGTCISQNKQHLLEMVYYFIVLVKVMMALLLRSPHVLFPPCHKIRVANLYPDERLWRTFETTIFEPKMSVTTNFLASFSVISNSTYNLLISWTYAHVDKFISI